MFHDATEERHDQRRLERLGLEEADSLLCFVQNYGPLLTAGAILFSALIAICAILYNIKVARRRATIDLVLHEKFNPTLVDARRKILALHEAKTEFTKFALKGNESSDEAMTILQVLNFLEFVAAGIKHGAFDELIYKHVQFSVVMRDWGECEGFVRELRKSRNRPTLFQEVQWLAEKWKKKPLERYF